MYSDIFYLIFMSGYTLGMQDKYTIHLHNKNIK